MREGKWDIVVVVRVPGDPPPPRAVFEDGTRLEAAVRPFGAVLAEFAQQSFGRYVRRARPRNPTPVRAVGAEARPLVLTSQVQDPSGPASDTECAEYADEIGVPLCLENQPRNESKRRYTTSPADLEAALQNVPIDGDALGVTLDVCHAKANGYDWHDFVERFGNRIRVCHLHDNDGTGDTHDPLPSYSEIVETVPADYFVFEMKSVDDVARCMGVENLSIDTTL